MGGKFLILVTLLVGCESSPKYGPFAVGTCIDRSDWVQDSRELIGNYYKIIRYKTREPDEYLVETCQIYSRDFPTQFCSQLEPLWLPTGDHPGERYDWIKCPLVKGEIRENKVAP